MFMEAFPSITSSYYTGPVDPKAHLQILIG